MKNAVIYAAILAALTGPALAAQTSSQAGSQDRYIMIDPDSMVRFGFDYDGDNRIDAYESIYGYDLMLLTPQGRQRMQQRQSVSQQGMQQRQPIVGGQPQSGLSTRRQPSGQVLNTLTGEIEDLKQVRLSGMNQRHVVAMVTTEQGRTHAVDLGPKDQLSQLQLQTGDWISIRGVQGSINRRKMLMAMQVRTEDQQIRVNRPQGSRELRFSGEIKETTVRSLGQNRPDHLLALVELDNKEKVVVDLGSQSVLERQNLDLSRNDDIVFLALPARFDGKNLLTATRLSVDGETFQVDSGARM